MQMSMSRLTPTFGVLLLILGFAQHAETAAHLRRDDADVRSRHAQPMRREFGLDRRAAAEVGDARGEGSGAAATRHALEHDRVGAGARGFRFAAAPLLLGQACVSDGSVRVECQRAGAEGDEQVWKAILVDVFHVSAAARRRIRSHHQAFHIHLRQ